jgi:LuxR family maltose regulon positive regulatory protein
LLVHLARGMWRCATGSWTEAVAQFRAGEQMQELLVTQHALTPQMRGFGVVALLRSGRIDHARAAVERLEAAEAPCGESLTAVAGVRLADGEYERALDMLAPIFERTAPVAHDSTIVQARMLAAQALAERGDRAASEHAVEQALQLAERDRLVLPFVMASGIALLQRHPRHVTAHAQLLTDILDIASGCAVPTDSDVEPLAEALSGAELRVLGYLPSNLSTPEISAELYLSVNTVRTHVRHIYDKLGAHNRSDAVSRARQLGRLGRTSG